MKLTFLGAAREVTGSCTLLEAAGKKILIDCGMEQGADTYENCEMPVSPADIDCLLLTHAHIDHSGRIPQLTSNGFRGKIYTTSATKKLCEIMLMDSAHIQESEAEWRNRKAKRSGGGEYTPMYTGKDAAASLKQFSPCEYGESYNIFPEISISFIDAGHLLGSASIEITATENGETRKILFSGDIGNIDRPLIKNPQFPQKADVVIMESTYGNRLHSERRDYLNELATVIQQTLDKGGNVVIPSFAIGRTQELLYIIHLIKRDGIIKNHPDFEVWVDSPLAIEATQIYSMDMERYYDEETLALLKSGENILKFSGLKTSVTSQESMFINNDPTPKVIISASGMCEAGRIRHHLKHNLWRENSTVLFVGYQSAGSLGRALLEGAPTVKLFGEQVTVNAKIAKMNGISGHADKKILLEWVNSIEPKPAVVYVNHGDDISAEEFAQTLKNEFSLNATAPYNGAVYDLLTGECLEKGNTKLIEKKSAVSARSNSLFAKLTAAGKRLMSVIEKNKNGTNKNIAKFTSQIEALCDKWEV